MAKELLGLDGVPLADKDRVQPFANIDAPDGKWRIPVVLISQGQFQALVEAIADRLENGPGQESEPENQLSLPIPE